MGSNFKNYLNTFVFDTDLPGSGQNVSFHPVTTGQLKRLLLYETTDDPLAIETALDELIEECIIKPEGLKAKDLYVQDRFYLMVEIRKATRGATYQFQTTCTSCGSQTQQNINLSSLPVTTLSKVVKKDVKALTPATKQRKGKLVEKTEEPKVVETKPTADWNVVKLNDNISLRLDLVTRKLQQDAFDLFKANHPDMSKVSDIERTLDVATLLYAMAIKSVITPDGEEELSLEDKVFLLDNIQQSEQEKISKWYDDHDFGIDFSFNVKCAQCGFEEKKEVPVDSFFY
jgi:hypothetical protein